MIGICISRSTEGIMIVNHYNKQFDAFKTQLLTLFSEYNVHYEMFSETMNKDFTLTIQKSLYKKIQLQINIMETILSHCDFNNPVIKVELSEQKILTKSAPLNTIEMSLPFMEKQGIEENQNITLFDMIGGTALTCTVKTNPNLDDHVISLSSSILNLVTNKTSLFIQGMTNLNFTKAKIQTIHDVLDGSITIGDHYQSLIGSFDCDQFVLINRFTGSSMDIDKDKIHFSSLEDDEIKLSYFHRLVLDADLPHKLSRHEFLKLNQVLPLEDQTILTKYFQNEKSLTSEILNIESDHYNHKQRIMTCLRQAGYPHLELYPVLREKLTKRKHRIWNWILGKIIRSVPLTLKAIRPYETDEMSNAIRLSKSTMELLGVDETDTVILTYRTQRIKARVLEIQEMESLKDTNIFQTESEWNVCIGIPAHLRKKLGIQQINTCCQVERDKNYLFWKNLNIQFISIIATVLTIKQSFQNGWVISGLLVLGIPLSIYIIFSGVRNRIGNK